MTNLPSGTVTFLFTDIEGSTKLAQENPDKWHDDTLVAIELRFKRKLG